MKDGLMIKGTLELIIENKSGSKRVIHKNLITFSGLSWLADMFYGDSVTALSDIAAGSGTTAPTENDVGLETEYSRVAISTTTKLTGPDANKVKISATWGLGAIVGDVTEAGLYAVSMLFNRAVFPAETLTVDDLLVINWTIEFVNV